jgi:hypothetical protein
MSELVIEVGYQVPPNAVYIRTSGDEIRVTVHPEPEADVLATLRDDIVDAIIDLSKTESESAEDSGEAMSNAEVSPTDVVDARETKQPR